MRILIQGSFQQEATMGVLDRAILSDRQWDRISDRVIGRPDQC
ncbi:MAG: hypothetical protein ACI89J_002923, partial [Hyphomicrobiaceae bacterium]